MPLDPVLQQLIANFPPVLVDRPDYPTVRAQAAAMLPLIVGPDGLAEVESVEDMTLETGAAPVPMRIYRPETAVRGTVHYVHGGGWSLGDLATVDHTARRLCRDLSMVVVTSTYRLAPEHQFPAAFDDSLAAAIWVSENRNVLGGAERPAIIAGDSAGGNLVAAIVLFMRDDTKAAPPFDLQLLLYPAVDLRQGNEVYASRRNNADPTLRAEMLEICVKDYAGAANLTDPRISPICAATLADLPTAIIVVLSVDPLRDEAVEYAHKLKAAGVKTELIEFDNLTHGFTHMAGIVPAAATATDQILASVRSALEAFQQVTQAST
jgi:acetyl esterase